ncbi:transcriptional regulator YeiL [Bacillus arachidis]|uniref:Transcriptional regulator YeiL n=1 Tax=Bacillus arachidis TaxID=2819290 RepID=A0ABS3NT73_9BACI|nr:transcriptional regulator YeiL [Bacillus arachidis]MBO1624128.1 transcriptional regulator YeiL [Bacillus arachidis]
MKIKKDSDEIHNYVKQFNFQTFFSFDILPYIEIHSFQKKETICNEGEEFPYLYYLISGKVKIYMSHQNGRISLINFVKAPSIMGELGLIGVETLTKGIEAMEPCICLALPLKDCRHLLLQDAHFLQQLCKFIGEKTITRTEQYAKSHNYALENRLAAFILLTEQNNCYLEKHTETSEYLNVSYRHLLFVLKQFCQQNWLKKEGRMYFIQDKEQLQKLADELIRQ